MIKNTKSLLAALMLFLLSGSAFAHGVQLRWHIADNGNVRVWIEHWHSLGETANVSNFPLSVSTSIDGAPATTTTYYADGVANGVTAANIPGPATTFLSGCLGDENTYNNWVYWDFAPPACNTPVELTIIAGLAATTADACGTLYPQTIISTFADAAGPVITANDLNVNAEMNCDSTAVVSYGVTATDACVYASGGTLTYSIPEGTVFSLGSTEVVVTATDSLSNSSVDTFNVVVVPDNYVGTSTPSVCSGADFTYMDGTIDINIVSPVSHTSHLTRVNGCDSTVTENVGVINPVYTTNYATICYGDAYVVGDSSYSTDGVYYNTIASLLTGCDSVVTSYLTVNENLALPLYLNLDTLVGNTVAGGSYRWLDCSDYSVITGETTSMMEVTATGNYAMETTQYGCVDTTDCMEVTLTDDFSNIIKTGDTYTGHATDLNGTYVVVFEQDQESIDYYLINNGGVIVEEMTLQNVDGFTIDMSSYEGGIYYLHVMADGPDHVAKIINPVTVH